MKTFYIFDLVIYGTHQSFDSYQQIVSLNAETIVVTSGHFRDAQQCIEMCYKTLTGISNTLSPLNDNVNYFQATVSNPALSSSGPRDNNEFSELSWEKDNLMKIFLSDKSEFRVQSDDIIAEINVLIRKLPDRVNKLN